MENIGFPYRSFPTGWFQIAWSDEVPACEVRPFRYFDRDLVAYRGEGGSVYVLDAYCPHLGAHLGYGGTVAGEEVVCPFHGWRWDGQGCNTDIPYGSKKNTNARICTWPVREVNGMIMVWYDEPGEAPTWEPPIVPEYEDSNFSRPSPETTRIWRNARVQPQLLGENAVDFAHQKYVHGATAVPELKEYEAIGPLFRSLQSIRFGQGKKSTWLTPTGEVEAWLEAELWGPGLFVARFKGTDDAAHVATQTPIDHNHSDMRTTVFCRLEAGEPGGISGRMRRRLEFEYRQVENDLQIWEHMRYQPKPLLTSEESKCYRALRAWFRQFYRGEEDAEATRTTTTGARQREPLG